MDNLIVWIKNNQTRAAAIALLLGALAYTQLANKPRNLEAVSYTHLTLPTT